MQNYSKKNVFFLLVFFIGVFFIEYFNYWKASHQCFNTMDLGLYTQVFAEGDLFSNWNPWISLRGIHVFNDHVDPILLLLPIINKGSYFLTPLFWEFFFTCLTGVVTFILLWRHGHASLFGFSLLHLLLNRGQLNALLFPVHPATWTPFICLFFIYCFHHISQEKLRYRGVFLLIASFLLLLFREDYPYAILGISIYLFLIREIKWATTQLFVGLLGIYIAQYLRPQLIGPIFDYGSELLGVIAKNPAQELGLRFKNFPWSSIKIFIPVLILLIPAYVSYYKKQFTWLQKLRHPMMACLFFIGPLLAIRFLAGKMDHHYTAPLVATLIGSFIFSFESKNLIHHFPILKYLSVILLFVTGPIPQVLRQIPLIVNKQSDKCVVDSKKTKESKKIFKVLKNINIGNQKPVILLTGGLATQAVRPGYDLRFLGGFSSANKEYDYFFLERNNVGNIWPMNSNQIEDIIKSCSSYASKEILNSFYFYAAKGPFPHDCLTKLKNSFVKNNKNTLSLE